MLIFEKSQIIEIFCLIDEFMIEFDQTMQQATIGKVNQPKKKTNIEPTLKSHPSTFAG